MNREIKFRAWHKNANYMCQNVTTGFLDRDYLELMQYIGIKDKNKKEVYEGDIVRITWVNGKIGGDYKVFYFKEGAFFQLENIKDENDLDTFCGYSTEQIEVIGNIYQNLDSLEIK